MHFGYIPSQRFSISKFQKLKENPCKEVLKGTRLLLIKDCFRGLKIRKGILDVKEKLSRKNQKDQTLEPLASKSVEKGGALD